MMLETRFRPRARTARRGVLALLAALPLAACHEEPAADAYGNFEAVEVVVSAQNPGTLLDFTPREGDRLEAGARVAILDTVQLSLERAQLLAQVEAAGARLTEAARQMEVVAAQLEVARRSYERTKRLFDSRAATAQQLDQAERDYRTLAAQERAVGAQRASVGRELEATRARVEQVEDRIARSIVSNPVAGTVLTTYARVGELAQPGMPLYRIANLDTLELRAYVDGGQLPGVTLGAAVRVRVDRGGDSLRTLPGEVSWISDRAEFTPTPVQTREERVDLVYAVKVRVPNPGGVLKIGMPGEVDFGGKGAKTVARAARP